VSDKLELAKFTCANLARPKAPLWLVVSHSYGQRLAKEEGGKKNKRNKEKEKELKISNFLKIKK